MEVDPQIVPMLSNQQGEAAQTAAEVREALR
jgi:gold/copper resistance efflux system membrane fusion protein